MVIPNCDSRLARSMSTWIHWWSSVTSAKRLIISCVTVNQSLAPTSWPVSARNSSRPLTTRGFGMFHHRQIRVGGFPGCQEFRVRTSRAFFVACQFVGLRDPVQRVSARRPRDHFILECFSSLRPLPCPEIRESQALEFRPSILRRFAVADVFLLVHSLLEQGDRLLRFALHTSQITAQIERKHFEQIQKMLRVVIHTALGMQAPRDRIQCVGFA